MTAARRDAARVALRWTLVRVAALLAIFLLASAGCSPSPSAYRVAELYREAGPKHLIAADVITLGVALVCMAVGAFTIVRFVGRKAYEAGVRAGKADDRRAGRR